MRRKKKIKNLERKVSYLFDLLINLSIKVGELNKSNLGATINKQNDVNFNYTIVKESNG